MTLPPDLAELLASHPELMARADSLLAAQEKPLSDEVQRFINMTRTERAVWRLQHAVRDRVSEIAIEHADTTPPVEIVDDDDWVKSPWDGRKA
ncbi:hypothetical protein ACFQ3P_13805 [Paraburkholderia sabiae]|uniref:Uncharacterized protein n=1 Tax=Paraburkholderia sabiae TaxID=273251 RepID=A0ABU9QDA5_9BURK|nr:hypothetical protein [Paraburkholderia sabiae]WJZ76174.1 hypothetical protein QEN71_10345 [Paraburkholderia sabiae]CAD6525936.1 hypothetical protein LMG24235_01900 [Paraburkholderia sabiae]